MISEDYHCVRYVPSRCFHVYAIKLRITTVSVCHVCSAHLCLGVSSYTSGLVSVSPSQLPTFPHSHVFLLPAHLCHHTTIPLFHATWSPPAFYSVTTPLTSSHLVITPASQPSTSVASPSSQLGVFPAYQHNMLPTHQYDASPACQHSMPHTCKYNVSPACQHNTSPIHQHNT